MASNPPSETILAIGASCATCHTIDFLPTRCPSCGDIYCSNHLRIHQPCSDPGLGYKESNTVVGPSSFKPRGGCEVQGCGRMSIEGVGGLGEADRGGTQRDSVGPAVKADAEVERIAKEVRCPGCGGAYCVAHRAQTSHDCTAPLAHNARHDAFITRKAQAQAVLAKTFPDQAGRVIPKPPPAKDVQRPASASKATSSAARTTSPLVPLPDVMVPALLPIGDTATKTTKSKDERMWDIHVRKIRSLASPLKGSAGGFAGTEQERRFFEWGKGDEAGIRSWEGGAKWAGKLERSWVLGSMPLGRLLDLMMAATATPAPKTLLDPSQTWTLILLDASPSAPSPRWAVPLRTDLPVEGQIRDGTTIVLCKGWASAGEAG